MEHFSLLEYNGYYKPHMQYFSSAACNIKGDHITWNLFWLKLRLYSISPSKALSVLSDDPIDLLHSEDEILPSISLICSKEWSLSEDFTFPKNLVLTRINAS